MNTSKKLYKSFRKSKLRDNLVIFYHKYRKIKNRGLFDSIEIETTTECNRKCSFCPNSKYDRGNHLMDENIYYTLIDSLKLHNFKGSLSPHFYGEPLLDPRLPKFLRYTRNNLKKCLIKIHTNGDFLDKDMLDILAPYVDVFVVSIYDDEPKIEENKNITFKKLDGIDISNRGGVISNKESVYHPVRCFLPMSHLVIDWKGNVILCCHDYFSSAVFGNIKFDDVYDIWSKPFFSKARSNIANGIFDFDICKKCKFKSSNNWSAILDK